ncbi:hypothetical protein CDL15_Pgr026996 [Punica granatum]|uniref:Uncharacterized protein n=1 Tax=Punica granatum TaxID=22663 RepID=A0A218W8Q3_PUNGR|nr:hypothetical protein CDL15_Pgr026996 [Punica granatum]
MENLTPRQCSWSAPWSPRGPMVIRCLSITGLPLISHLGCTLVFPSRMIKQLGSLQDILADTDHTTYQIAWANSAPSPTGRFLQANEILQIWDTRLTQDLYFPEHSTDEERAYCATSTYVAFFYLQNLGPQAAIPGYATPTTMHKELRFILEERDQHRHELTETIARLIDQKEIRRVLAQARTRKDNLNREIIRLNTTLDQARARAQGPSQS